MAATPEACGRARTSRSTGRSIAARPDVAAIAHAHLAASLALTIVGQVPDPADLPETALLLPRLPYRAVRRDG